MLNISQKCGYFISHPTPTLRLHLHRPYINPTPTVPQPYSNPTPTLLPSYYNHVQIQPIPGPTLYSMLHQPFPSSFPIPTLQSTPYPYLTEYPPISLPYIVPTPTLSLYHLSPKQIPHLPQTNFNSYPSYPTLTKPYSISSSPNPTLSQYNPTFFTTLP